MSVSPKGQLPTIPSSTMTSIKQQKQQQQPREDSAESLDSGDNDGRIELKKQINLFHCASIIIGIIVGGGIFVSPVGITLHVRSVGMSVMMWGVAGFFSMLCALCYAELGSCIPESGGEYVYIQRAWGDFAAFMCLWMNYIIINPVCVAASSLVFATYVLRPLFPDCEPPVEAERVLAALIIAFLVAINCHSVQWVTKLQAAITFCKLAALIVIIVIGFVWLGNGHSENFQNSFADSDYSAGAISISFYSGFFAFGGWSYLNFLTDEVINPHRNLPLGIMISITAVTFIYITANIAYFAVLTPQEMLTSSAVAVTFLERTVSSLSYVVPVLIAISVVGGMNGSILSMSRLFYVAAKNNHLPRIISMITVKSLTPTPSLISMFALVVIMQSFGNIFFLVEMMGFCLAIVLVMVFAGQVLLRWTEPDLYRPIKLPVALPIFLSCACAAILGITVYQKPQESGIALSIVACGLPAYVLGSKWDKPDCIQNILDDVTSFLQKLMLVTSQDACEEDDSDNDDVDAVDDGSFGEKKLMS